MENSRQFNERFLEEARSLEKFRLEYVARHPRTPLDREDPDVQRLVEALAYFNARSRHWVRQNQLRTTRRIFRQYFSYLLDPMPAMGILEPTITGRFVEAAEIPRQTEVLVRVDRRYDAVFYTLWDTRILPVRLTSVEFIKKIGQGQRVLMRFRTPYGRNDDIGTLSLYINQLSDFYSSLVLREALREHVQSVSISFAENVSSQTQGEDCRYYFGAPRNAEDHFDRFDNPIEKVRRFFHFPEAELYFNIDVGFTPNNWDKFTIIIDLDESWPNDIVFNEDSFRFGAVPIVNLRRSLAEPFEVNGKKSRFPIIFTEPGDYFELHSINAVYEVTNTGYKPLLPGVLPIGGSSFEYEFENNPNSELNVKNSFVLLKMPQAFGAPKEVVVDAFWHQPWFTDYIDGRVEPYLYDRTIVGLDWQLSQRIVPFAENPANDNVEALLQLLALRTRTMIDCASLKMILESLGTLSRGQFKNIPRLIEDVEIKRLPPEREASFRPRLRYNILLREIDTYYQPLLEAFFQAVKSLLNAWVTDAIIELRLTSHDSENSWDLT